MKLVKLDASRYRSLRAETVRMSDLNVFIGANAAGKSTVLDALRFLHEGVQTRDFRSPVFARGGMIHLPWKGEEAEQVELKVQVDDGGERFEWRLCLVRDGYEFHVEEEASRLPPRSPPVQLLFARRGVGWWWSGERSQRVKLKQAPTMCALAAAAADASFPARRVAEFVGRWGFFDPNPFLLRRDWIGLDSGRFDPYGRNLGETLYGLRQSSPAVFERIVAATQSILGLPSEIVPRKSDDDRFFFVQREPGLQYAVHQMGASSGTLHMMALMTALFSEPEANLIGIEEPENSVHPTALASFMEHLSGAQDSVQFVVTTHSPLLLDHLNDPDAIRIVQRDADGATTVRREDNLDDVRRALEETGFGLGEFYETTGFGAN